MYSSKVKYENIPDEIKKYPYLHNIDEEDGYQPRKLGFLRTKRVIISTVCMAGRFASKNESKHFGYIFIDECGNSTEPASLVPIMGNYVL